MANYMGKGKDAEVSSPSFVIFKTLMAMVYALNPSSLYAPNVFELWHILELSYGFFVVLTRGRSRVISAPK